MTIDHLFPGHWTATEIDRRNRWVCEHRHNGLRHANCYNKAHNLVPRIGFLDIETSNLKANFGIVLAWCMKREGETEIISDVFSKNDFEKEILDARLVKSCVNALGTIDIVIGHYLSRFDIPFLRTRAIMLGIDFPEYGKLKMIDTYDIAKSKLCLHSKRQNVIAEALHGKTEKTRLDFHSWIGALQGKKKDLEYVLTHCLHDVKDLERNYNKLKPFTRYNLRSI